MEKPQEENVQKESNCGLEWFQFPDFQDARRPRVPGACGHKGSISEDSKRGSFLGKALDSTSEGGREGNLLSPVDCSVGPTWPCPPLANLRVCDVACRFSFLFLGKSRERYKEVLDVFT